MAAMTTPAMAAPAVAEIAAMAAPAVAAPAVAAVAALTTAAMAAPAVAAVSIGAATAATAVTAARVRRHFGSTLLIRNPASAMACSLQYSDTMLDQAESVLKAFDVCSAESQLPASQPRTMAAVAEVERELYERLSPGLQAQQKE
eukprot:753397-Lingulodinium_polyedra.AAC.1